MTRITHATVQRSTLANLQANLHAAARLQAQMSSGTKISVPSDDPSGAHDLLRLRAEQRTTAQHQRNVADGDAWLATVDTALTQSLSIMRGARDLAVRAGSGALGPDAREALAAEVEARRDALLQQANTTYSGRQVFAGTTAGPAFTTDTTTTPPGYAWHGTGAAVTRQVGSESTVRVDADGSAVFGTGPTSAFAALDALAAAIRSGDSDMTAGITAIDGHVSAMLEQVASVGARHNQVLEAKDVLATRSLTLTQQVSGVEDVDLAEVILQVQSQEVAYRGALGAAAKVLQPSLMDFLR
ncbi:flagellar hook-associated protein FlgL [Cellulomonas sp. zg-ZUI222]|uniref:flagellar hook-associated protein FlgL n=1 Tax=Cellulomonas wangleii TaxID=2816956 RepID=UPI001A951795|nr:flagellar hook-associated protein FlgL [Cellulomonas wangleii]MBO0922404.1 flagellar hook-associated protein FlgL [Cellulomonas wangleii]